MKAAASLFACFLASLALASVVVVVLELVDAEGFCYQSGYAGLSSFDGFFYALHDKMAVMAIVIGMATAVAFPVVVVAAWLMGLLGMGHRRQG